LSGARHPGRVVAAHGRHYVVELADGELLHALPRGKKSSLACGDRVQVTPTAAGQGVIEAVDPRSTLFYRSAAHRAKLLAANATQAVVVVAGEPSFSDELIARVLAAAEHERMRAFIVLNKCDLSEPTAAARRRLAPFAQAGYRIVETHAAGAAPHVAALAAALAGETTVLIGQSGMGKSTLVNALVPGAGAATREISRFLDSGRHTTTDSRLHALPDGALVDCPGMQEFGLAHLGAGDIERAFVDVRPFLGHCRFRDCRHRAEPGCAVRAAAATGALHPRRLELLLRILDAEAGRVS
jgi:ribosome biogenesis GTPase